MRQYKITCKIKDDKKPIKIIRCSQDLVQVFRDSFDKDTLNIQESFWACFMNARNEVIGMYNVSNGGMTSTIADIRLILTACLLSGATKLAIAHNHPSGAKEISEADRKVTNKISFCCGMFDINFLDHIILLDEGYVSLSAEGYLENFDSETIINEFKKCR